jgi:hypothetical protein
MCCSLFLCMFYSVLKCHKSIDIQVLRGQSYEINIFLLKFYKIKV